MYYSFRIARCLFLAFLSVGTLVSLQAQVSEEILTESDDSDLDDLFLFDESTPLDGVVERKSMEGKSFLEYPSLSETDVFWEKYLWGVVDVREKINQPFAAPQSALFKLMLEGINEGKIKVYTQDDFKEQMTEDQVQSLIFDTDTTFVTNPETYEQEMEIVQNELNSDNIKKFRLKEVWYVDKKASMMRVRILGIAPILDKVSEETETVYSYPMFWIHWPSCRSYFSKKKVYLPGNDATTLSWDDYLEMRFFNYYVIKESNARNMSLSDYPSLQGDDEVSIRKRMMVSKKIKDEIFNFEQDLWSY